MKRTLCFSGLPWPGVQLSQNGRSHWAKKAALTKNARNAAAYLCRAAMDGPLPVLKAGTKLNVRLIVLPPDNRRRDESNMIERCKAYYDGIADALELDDCIFHHREQIWLGSKKPGNIGFELDWEEEE